MKPNLRIFETPQKLTRAAAEEVIRVAQESIAARQRFTLVLAGGSTPRALYALLADDPLFRDQMPWKSTLFFWGDERCVPPDHADSNFRMANESMLTRTPVLKENIHRIKAEQPDAAEQYARTLTDNFSLRPGDFPQFDLVLLGMGADGHTLSLFPHTAALDETEKLVVLNSVTKLSALRVTLTAPTVNHARHIVFLIAGADKAPALKSVVEGPANPREYPAQLIASLAGRLTWMVDKSAAAELNC